MIDGTFARSKFEAEPDPQMLCAQLAEILTARIRAAKNLHMEIEWIVADLRKLGHKVQHWDGVIANWSEPNQRRPIYLDMA